MMILIRQGHLLHRIDGSHNSATLARMLRSPPKTPDTPTLGSWCAMIGDRARLWRGQHAHLPLQSRSRSRCLACIQVSCLCHWHHWPCLRRCGAEVAHLTCPPNPSKRPAKIGPVWVNITSYSSPQWRGMRSVPCRRALSASECVRFTENDTRQLMN